MSLDPSGTVRDMSMAGTGTRRMPDETLREVRPSELHAVA